MAVTVSCVDDNPTAVNDTKTVLEDSGATAIDVLANDNNADGGPLTIDSVTQPTHGTVAITGGGTGLTYTPNPNYCNTRPAGLDRRLHLHPERRLDRDRGGHRQLRRRHPDRGQRHQDGAEDSGPTAIDVLANDNNADGGPLTIDSVTQPAHGTVAITGGGTGLTYTPNPNYCNTDPPASTDDFTYTLNGGSTATVAVTVTCVDDAPDRGQRHHDGARGLRPDRDRRARPTTPTPTAAR